MARKDYPGSIGIPTWLSVLALLIGSVFYLSILSLYIGLWLWRRGQPAYSALLYIAALAALVMIPDPSTVSMPVNALLTMGIVGGVLGSPFLLVREVNQYLHRTKGSTINFHFGLTLLAGACYVNYKLREAWQMELLARMNPYEVR